MLAAVPLMMAVCAPASHAADPCEPVAARIVSLQGRVEVRAAGAVEWAVISLHDGLCFGDTVRVGALSRAALALPDNPTLRLDQLTTLRLVGTTESGNSWLDLLAGMVHFFSRRPHALQIDTPVANAGTEGTEFLMRVAEDRTEVVMFEGRVRLTTPAGELLVASGDAALVLAGAAPVREIVARPRDAVAWTLYYPPVLAPLAGGGAASALLPPGLQRAVERVAANDFAGAIAALDTVPAGARDARYFTYRAGVLLNVGQAGLAEEALARALELDPAASEALAQRAVLRVAQNRRAEALADAQRAVELSPDAAPARIALSYALQAGFELEAARAELREATRRSPENALAWARLAELELSFGDLGAAQRAAERAVALAPGLARTQMVLGFAALTRIDIREARAAFERAIDLDSALPLARLGQGLARIRAGDLDAGAVDLEIAVALDPDDSLLRSYLGKAYFEERRGPLDAEQYQIAKELDPNDPTPWFYDAIRLQTENRPVEALRNLEKSIALNDNRAVYRSRLLLDEDRATRGTSLARIYDDLGFEQIAINAAARSLTLDPASTSAHRFLSDTYQGGPRLELARVSELLQAQMLQDININPVQPSLSEANWNLAARGGPAGAGFNEFTPLFERQQAQVNATGLVGNDDTYGAEGVISMLYDRYSLSAGGAHFETNGWRDNYNVDDDVYNLFGQAAITPELNAQFEVRKRNLNQGDLAFNFDPDNFSNNLRIDLDEESARAGLRYSPTPQADFLLSLIHSDRQERRRDTLPLNFMGVVLTQSNDATLDERGYQVEGQQLFRADRFNLTTGFGFADVDGHLDTQVSINGGPPSKLASHPDVTHPRGYVYGNLRLPDPVYWTVGLSYDDIKRHDVANGDGVEVSQFNPKFGVQWDVTEAVSLRAAAFRTVKPALVAGRTLEPTQVAGFNQLFDDVDAAKSWNYAVGLDWRPTEALSAGAELSWRDLDEPIFQQNDDTKFESSNEEIYRGYLYWVPLDQIAVSAEIIYDDYDADEGANTSTFDLPKKVETLSVPLSIRYFDPRGFFAGVGVTYVNQDVRRAGTSTLGNGSGSDDFAVVDALVGYRLPKRFGIASLQVNNLFDTGFNYQDDSFREFRDAPSIARYSPQRTIIGRVTISF